MAPWAPAPPRASAVIPVKDGAAHLDALLLALEEQEVEGGLEVLAVDSGSTDGSLAILERHSVGMLRVAPEEFDHGGTRNLAAREARGEVVVFLSQDAVPLGRTFVARLIAPLERRSRVVGSFARQVARPDADPLTRRDLSGWVAARSEPRIVFLQDPNAYHALPPRERYALAAFDNVASAVERGVLLEHPFRPTSFGEDLEWGLRMLRLGYGLAYVPESVVIHSHPRSARALFRRNYLGHRLLLRLFGLKTVPDWAHLLRSSLGAVASDFKTLAAEGASLDAWLAAPAQALAATYGQYLGARDEARGRPYPQWA